MACSYGFDGNGKRVKKTESGASTYYVYSSVIGSAVMEVASAGVQRAYVMNGGNVLAQRNPDGQFYWLHMDHLGSGRKMTNTSGNLTYRAEFDPYGKLTYEWSATPNQNTKKFTGYERDAGSGLDYAQARMYASEWGRFLSPDPLPWKKIRLKRPRSLNRYSYVEGNPVNFTDPSGLDCFETGCNISGGGSGPIDTGGNRDFGLGGLFAPEEDGREVLPPGGGGDVEPVADDYVQQLSDALLSLGKGCIGFLGGINKVKELAANMKSAGMKVVAVGGVGYTNTIQNGKETHQQFWENGEKKSTAVARAVGYGGKDSKPGAYLTIILGPLFFNNTASNPYLNDNKEKITYSSFADFQRDALFHEYWHVYTNLNDPDFADEYQLAWKGYDVSNPSLAIQNFIKHDCQPLK